MKPTVRFAKKTEIYDYFCRLISKYPNLKQFLKNYCTVKRYQRTIYASTFKTKLDKVGVKLSYKEFCNWLIIFEELGILRLTNLDLIYKNQKKEGVKLAPLDDYGLMIEFKVNFPDLAFDVLRHFDDKNKNNYDYEI
jgi:hypothetical protein